MADSTNRVYYSRQVFLILAWIYAVCIIAQTLIAGMAVIIKKFIINVSCY